MRKASSGYTLLKGREGERWAESSIDKSERAFTIHHRGAVLPAMLPSVLVGLLWFLSGCRAEISRLQFTPGAMVLHLATRDDIPTLDPVAGYDTASWAFEQMLFDTLVRYSDSGVDLVPDAATNWESSPDSQTFTFHL